jgi:hypothetical protein
VRIVYQLLLTAFISSVWVAIAIPGICQSVQTESGMETAWWLSVLFPHLLGIVLM